MGKLLSQRTAKINSLEKQKKIYLFCTEQTKLLKGTVVNRTLSSLHGGSLEITLTVPLKVQIRNYVNQRPNLKYLSRGLNLSRGSNFGGST